MNENQSKMGRPEINLQERTKGLEEEFYTIEKLAQVMKVHYNTIKNGIHNGKIKAYKIGTQWRIKKSDIEQFREDKLVIPTNNKQFLKVEINEKKLFFTKIDSEGNKERVDSLTEEEIVLLYDYIIQRKDSGQEMF